MAYDPIQDAASFRVTLRRLTEVEHLTSQAMIDLFNSHRVRGDNLSISRATLDRFIQGEDVTRIRELRFIHHMLRSHPTYGAYFDAPASSSPGPAGGGAARFLFPVRDGRESPVYADMAATLPGQFVMMRRDHDSVTVENGVRLSSLTLEAEAEAIAVRETQRHGTPDYDMPFEQTDRGYMFTHGGHMCFLLKEVGGTCVKFGVIEQILPEAGQRQPAHYFQGHIMVVSRRGVFPRTRFAARRFSPNQHPVTSGIVRLADIDDVRAREHLRRDYEEGAAARTA